MIVVYYLVEAQKQLSKIFWPQASTCGFGEMFKSTNPVGK